MKRVMQDTLILFAITLIAGFLLGTVYEVTKEPIKVQAEKKKMEACKEVFADAEQFEEAGVSLESGNEAVDIQEVSKALSPEGTLLGYVIQLTTHEGYNGDIQFTMGIRLDGTLNGISLLSISETPGLGMKAEEVLKPQFVNKKAPQFSYTKVGAVTEDQIDAISGATITTNAVTNGVNTGLHFFHEQLGGIVNE